jgi:hypothetical protein
MLLLLSLMTKKSFCTSELRLLTTNWTRITPSMSRMQGIYYGHPTRPRSPWFAEKRKRRFCGKKWVCLVRIRWRVANLPLPPILIAVVQSLEYKWDKLKARISYQRILKTVISYVSQSRGWTTTLRTYSWWVIHFIVRTEQQPLVRHGMGAYALM